MKNLNEDSRSDLIRRSKKADHYKDTSKGKTRYDRRVFSKLAGSVKDYNKVDMNKLFKENILDLDVGVHGETNDYVVTVSWGGFLTSLQGYLEKMNTEDINFRVVSRALSDSFNHNDVYVHCSCLHPDTIIPLLDGSTPTVKELMERFNNGEPLYVYSTDEKGDFKPGIVEKVWITKNTSEFIKVTLDNGEYILTTPDHLYMLRDGSYISAENLEIGHSLMPLYFNEFRPGYKGIKLNSTGKYHSVYKLVADYFKSDEIEKAKLRVTPEDSMPYDVAVHHIDFNKNNNNPENLKIMTAREHWDYHASCHTNISEEGRKKLSDRMKELNKNPTIRMIEGRKKWQEAGVLRNYDEDRKIQQAEIMRKASRKFWDSMTQEEKKEFCEKLKDKLNTKEVKEKISAKNKEVWKNYSEEEYKNRCEINKHNNEKAKELIREASKNYWASLDDEQYKIRCNSIKEGKKRSKENNIDWHKGYETAAFKEARKNSFKYARTREIEVKRLQTKIFNVIKKILDAKEIPSPETYEKFRTAGYPKYTSVFSTWEELSNFYELNHKITKIEKVILEDTPVYDIKVKDFHNFLVGPGVILHNCPDATYRQNFWQTMNNISSGAPENRPSDITNPNDTKGAGCKHVMLVLSNLSYWQIKMASVIFNYINYMKEHYERLYADVIYPAIFEREYEEPVQLDIDTLDNKEDKLDTDTDVIDTSNKWAKTKNLFKKSDIEKEPTELEGQKQFDLDSLMSD